MPRSIFTTLIACAALTTQSQVVMTQSGPFVVPAGVTSITLELIGAGGNGASNGGGGGGGGAYVRGTANVSPGQTISIVVGEGGSELATIAGGLGMFANAGQNATTVPNPNLGGGGAGGTGVGGQINRSGGAGGGGYWTYFGGGGGGAAGPTGNGTAGGNTIVYNGSNCLTPGGAGGAGGGGQAGAGGKGAGFTDNNCTVSDLAEDGGNYGAGGGGGNGIGSPVGIGGGGVCIITWNGSTGVDQVDPSNIVGATVFSDHIIIPNAGGDVSYQLVDATGRAVWSGVHVERQDLSHLALGTYTLLAWSRGSSWTRRLIKQ